MIWLAGYLIGAVLTARILGRRLKRQDIAEFGRHDNDGMGLFWVLFVSAGWPMGLPLGLALTRTGPPGPISEFIFGKDA